MRINFSNTSISNVGLVLITHMISINGVEARETLNMRVAHLFNYSPVIGFSFINCIKQTDIRNKMSDAIREISSMFSRIWKYFKGIPTEYVKLNEKLFSDETVVSIASDAVPAKSSLLYWINIIGKSNLFAFALAFTLTGLILAVASTYKSYKGSGEQDERNGLEPVDFAACILLIFKVFLFGSLMFLVDSDASLKSSLQGLLDRKFAFFSSLLLDALLIGYLIHLNMKSSAGITIRKLLKGLAQFILTVFICLILLPFLKKIDDDMMKISVCFILINISNILSGKLFRHLHFNKNSN